MNAKNFVKLFFYVFGFLGFHWLLVPAFSFHECMYYTCSQWPQFLFGVSIMLLGVCLFKNYIVVVFTLTLLVSLSVLDTLRAGESGAMTFVYSTIYQGFVYGGILVACIFFIQKKYLNINA